MEKAINELNELFRELESTYQEDRYTIENFNVFEAFRIKRSELAWSAWIAYLLNPNEKHGMGDVFLKLFLRQLGLPEDYVKKADGKIIERGVGPVSENYESGGRMDIIIHDSDNNKVLIIENKIDAKDQPNQLYRYYKFAHEERKFNDSRIYYLTLLKRQPSNESITGENGVLQGGKDKDFDCISYIDDIKYWLKACMYKCDTSNPIRSIIEQSIQTIDTICHQIVVNPEFREKVEKILNDNEKTTIAKKLEFFNNNKFEKYLRCSEQLSSLKMIYQRELFDEKINSCFSSPNTVIKTEGKTEGYWTSTANIGQKGIQSIQIMHDWKPDGTGQLICTIDCKNPQMISRLKKVDGYWPKDSIVNRLNWSFALDDFEGLYKTLDEILTHV